MEASKIAAAVLVGAESGQQGPRCSPADVTTSQGFERIAHLCVNSAFRRFLAVLKGGDTNNTTQRKSPASPPGEPYAGRGGKDRRDWRKHLAGVHERPGIFGEIPGSVW